MNLDEDLDEEVVLAALDLVGRTGAKQLQVGFLHEGVPVQEASWYAHAQYHGARITEENHKGPAEALEALARRLLTGAKCVHCGGLVTLPGEAPSAHVAGTLTDGTRWTAEQASAAGQCRWTRIGPRWARECA
ncbi:hypothetical protein Ssi03_62350 [Sphaerisporangium siamense]|uniref:Uncharacterized protein n=1 Tax=Sphaerisporangium siamense TaxID=795645 RepID=A0A7W7DBI3_9ACTN|nr:hypothetical protein [Sphaerisporangium siamense]MBB4702546.1 hypothetical protein [Sphaerisporangium siamense]GII88245.1 hypothetical protein Ssi03_62350 [Sphaerisporangium siamense]